MKSVESLTVARASQINSEMEDLTEDLRILANAMTRILSHPNDYIPRNFDRLLSNDVDKDKPFILLSEEIFYGRSPALESEMALATNIEDWLTNVHQTYGSSDNACYIASKNGYFICIDTIGIDDRLHKPFEARERLWYKEAQKANKIIFSNIYIDENGNKAITCAAPYYDGNDFAGVAGIGCNISTWYDLLVKNTVKEGRICFILNAEGKVILSSEQKDFIKITVEDTDLTESKDEKIAALAKKMTDGMIGVEEIDFAGKKFYISFAPMKATGWSLGILTPTAEVVETANNTKKYFLEQFHTLERKIEDESSRLPFSVFRT